MARKGLKSCRVQRAVLEHRQRTDSHARRSLCRGPDKKFDELNHRCRAVRGAKLSNLGPDGRQFKCLFIVGCVS
jgi:hypothetical protein